MASIAVVILNYNGVKYLRQFLPSVIEHSPGADVIVADNASTDESISFLKKHYPGLQLIILEENYGYAGGYNEALAQLKHEYCILLNSDIEVTPNWIEPVVHFMQLNPDAAACQPKILDYKEQTYFEYAGGAGGFLDQMGYPYCRGRVLDTIENDDDQYNSIEEIHWATGACLFIRRNIFEKAGGFDADFFAHMEEIDLCWRLRSMGHSIFCIPESKIYHVGGGTLNKIHPRKTYLNFRNNLYLLFKNERISELWWKLPLKWFMDWAAGLKFGMDQSWKHFGAVIKAQFHFLLHLPVMWRKRKVIQKSRTAKVSNSSFILPYQYYVRGRKTFRELHSKT